MKVAIILLFSFFCFKQATATELCDNKNYDCINTILGEVTLLSKEKSGDEYSYIKLNGEDIFKDKTDYMVPYIYGDYARTNGELLLKKTVITYFSRGACGFVNTSCNVNIIIDFTKKKPIISNSFIPPVDGSLIEWVSWGEKNSIIGFDDKSKFMYQNGKVIMTDGGVMAKQKEIDRKKSDVE